MFGFVFCADSNWLVLATRDTGLIMILRLSRSTRGPGAGIDCRCHYACRGLISFQIVNCCLSLHPNIHFAVDGALAVVWWKAHWPWGLKIRVGIPAMPLTNYDLEWVGWFTFPSAWKMGCSFPAHKVCVRIRRDDRWKHRNSTSTSYGHYLIF